MRRSSLGWVLVAAVASLVVTVTVAQAPAADPDAARRALVIAKFNGGQITVGSLEDDIKRQPEMNQMEFRDPAQLRDLYNRTLRFELLAQEAEHRGIQQRPDVLDSIKQNAVQTLYRKSFDERITPESMTVADVQTYYTAHPEEFDRPALRRASHIVVATRDEALKLLVQVKAGDVAAFRRLAREQSIDQTNKARGGDLRYFDARGAGHGEPGQPIPAAVVKAVFALKTVGDVAAQPVAIDGGFSIVKYTGERPAELRTLAQADESIRTRLWRQKRQEAMEAFVVELRARLKPEVHPELVDTITLEDVSPTAGIAPGFPTGHPPAAVDPTTPAPVPAALAAPIQ
jgi:parvulin-like peptidyl-prolyl isomerase